MKIETVEGVRIVVREAENYAAASKAAFARATEILGTGMLNLADYSERVSTGAMLFTYTVRTDG